MARRAGQATQAGPVIEQLAGLAGLPLAGQAAKLSNGKGRANGITETCLLPRFAGYCRG